MRRAAFVTAVALSLGLHHPFVPPPPVVAKKRKPSGKDRSKTKAARKQRFKLK